MSKMYTINSNCNIKKLEEYKVLAQIEGSFKILECSYEILNDVLKLISNGDGMKEIVSKYGETFGEDTVNTFVETLCAEGIISPKTSTSCDVSTNVFLVGEGLIFDYIKSQNWDNINIVAKSTTSEFVVSNKSINELCDTVIFAPEWSNYETFRCVNQKLINELVPFIPIYCTGESYICGPYVFPWQTPCLECGFTHHINALNRADNSYISMNEINDIILSKSIETAELSEQAKYLVNLLIRDIACVKKEETNFIFYKKELCFKKNIEDGYSEKTYQPITDCKCCHGMNRNFVEYNGSIEIPTLNSPFTDDDIQYNVGGLRSKSEAETTALVSNAMNDLGLNIEIKLVDNNIFNSVLPVYDSELKTMQKNKTPYFLDGGKSHGKGMNKKQAYFSAAFELFERVCSRYYGTETILRATPEEVKDHCIDLRTMTRQVPNVATVYDNFDKDMQIDWVWGKSLVSGKERLIPASFAFLSKTTFKDNFVPNGSSGLSAGAVLKDAVLQGLFEVIEHDAWMTCQANPIQLPIIDDSTIKNPTIKATIDKIKSLGYEIIIRDYTTDLNIPVIRTWISDPRNYTKYAFNGFGCSVNAELALERSITEAVQGFIPEKPLEPSEYGKILMVDSILSRDSLFGMYYFQKKDISPEGKVKSMEDIPNMQFSSVDDALRYVVKRITDVIPDSDVLFVDMTRPEFGIPVVKVIVTGGIQRLSEPLVTVSDRLINFPQKMGYSDRPFEYKELYLGPYQH